MGEVESSMTINRGRGMGAFPPPKYFLSLKNHFICVEIRPSLMNSV